MLLQKSWSSATVGSLLDSVLGLQAEADRFDIAGPEVLFGPKAALSLALLAHEMATNSVKYGALSADGGSIEIRWTLADQVFRLTWRERGGPRPSSPKKEVLDHVSSGWASPAVTAPNFHTRQAD